MASSLERSSDSKLLQHRTEVSSEYSSVSYPGDQSTNLPVLPLNSLLPVEDDDGQQSDVLLVSRVSYSEVMAQKISSLISDANSLKHHKPIEAISRLTKAIALDKNNSSLYQLRANLYLSSGDFPSTIVNLHRAIHLVQQQQQQSNDIETLQSLLHSVYYVYCQTLYDMGCYQEALEVLQVSSWLHQFNLQFNLRRIMCLSALGNYDECLQVINASVNKHGQLVDLLIMRARINYMFGNLSQCYYDITNVLSTCHGNNLEANRLREQLEQQANITRGQAVDYYLEGKNCESLKKITAAIDTDPSTGDYHVFRGVLLRLMADYSNAVDELLTAMDKCHHNVLSSTYQNASRQLLLTINDFAVYCYKQGQYADAVMLLNKAIADNQHEQGLYINRGDCFYRLRKLNFALSDYEQAQELSVDCCCSVNDQNIALRIAQVSYELGKSAFNRDDKEDAIHWLSLAIQHCPQVAAFYTARARAYFAVKDVQTAQKDLVTSLKLGEKEQNCYSILARLFPGQTAADVIAQHTAVKTRIDHVTNSLSNTTYNLATPPLQQEMGVARQWELLSRPLPPIRVDTEWSNEEREFHHEIYQIKKKVTKQVEDILTESSTFPPLPPVIQSFND